MDRDFKGIWIPKEIWLDENLSIVEKAILAEIISLDKESGCFASNQYFAEFCHLTERTVSNAINNLVKGGYVYVKAFDGRHRILQSRYEEFSRQGRKIFYADEKSFPPNNKDNNTNNNTLIKGISAEQAREVVRLFNTTCVSFPKVTALSADRQKHIAARLKQYGAEKIKVVFQKAEASSFLKGENNRKWKANFDWLINETNFAKVLDGNYDDKRGNGANTDNGESLKPATGQNINYDNYRRTGV